MLLRNDVLEYDGAPRRRLRVLWLAPARDLSYIYPLDVPCASPAAASLAALVADVRAGRARLLVADPWRARDIASLPPKHLALRARAWAVIAPLVRDEPAVFEARARARLIDACCLEHGVSRPTVQRYLRRYWERGQHPDALLPDYANSGAPGKTRSANAGVKRGRPTKSGTLGANADPGLRATMRAAVLRYAATHATFSRRAAYRQMIAEYFDGASQAAPTYGQFSYWLERDNVLATPVPDQVPGSVPT